MEENYSSVLYEIKDDIKKIAKSLETLVSKSTGS